LRGEVGISLTLRLLPLPIRRLLGRAGQGQERPTDRVRFGPGRERRLSLPRPLCLLSCPGILFDCRQIEVARRREVALPDLFQRQHFGNEPGAFDDIEPNVPFVGPTKGFSYDCPGVNQGETAFLMFQSRDVDHKRIYLKSMESMC